MGTKLGLEAASQQALHLFKLLVPWVATEQEMGQRSSSLAEYSSTAYRRYRSSYGAVTGLCFTVLL